METREDREEKDKKNKTGQKKKQKTAGRRSRWLILLIVVLVVAVVGIIVAIFCYRKYAPGKEHQSISEYYGLGEHDVCVILEDEIWDVPVLYQDNQVYLELSQIKGTLNDKFYWDSSESILLYTTPTAVISAEPNSKDSYHNNSKESKDYEIVRTVGEEVYVAIDYVKEYTALDYEVYTDPTRVVIHHTYGQEVEYVDTEAETELRVEPDIKSDILVDLEKEVSLRVLAQDEEAGFDRVMTTDGVTGYVRQKKLGDVYTQTAETDFREEEYSHILKDEKITLLWHQVTNQDANANLLSVLADTKGVNVICPTWFSTSDNKGNISSIASDTYVEQAHKQGVEVWALCDDFSPDMKIGKVLGSTSTRQKLEKNLVAEAIRYSLDGINIDFEYVKEESGEDFVQFIRELGIMCRNNGIVLSVDNYPLMDYTDYYGRAAQAEAADYVITMAYDEYYSGSEEAGPVSSLSYVENSTKDVLTQVPAQQTIIGLPFYSRYWNETTENGEVVLTSETCSMSYAQQMVDNASEQVVWDDAAGMNYLEVKNDNVVTKLWVEDLTSLQLKVEAVAEYDTAGAAFWKAGLEDSGVWDMIRNYNQ